AHLSAAAFKDLANFAGGAIAVVGKHFHHDRHTAGPIPFVRYLFERLPFKLAGAALHGPFDIVLGHADLARLVTGVAQFQVHFRIAAAVSRRDDDGPAQFAKQLAALGVDGALLVLDGRPVGMSGHDASFTARMLT